MLRSMTALCIATGGAWATADVRTQFIDPTLTHPDIRVLTEFIDGSDRNLGHYLAVDPDAYQSGRLFLFLPGSGGLPDDYEQVAEHAASVGHHVISLAYPNIPAVVQLIAGESDPNVPGAIRRERLFGDDRSDLVDVARPDSVEFRLARALEYANDLYPNAGWNAFLDGDKPDWSSIIVSGHSQGAGHTAYLTQEFNLAGAVMFAGPGDRLNAAPANWVLRPTLTTPARMFAFIHTGDRGFVGAIDNQEILGLDAFGSPRFVDQRNPPYLGTHQLFTARTPDPGSNEHNMIVVDTFLPVGADGVTPLYSPTWSYAIGVTGDVNRDNVVTLTDLAIVLGNFGRATEDPTLGDITADGIVDLADLGLVLGAFGN